MLRYKKGSGAGQGGSNVQAVTPRSKDPACLDSNEALDEDVWASASNG